MSENELLESILTAQVLTLAKALKAEKAAKGVTSTSDFIVDAARMIRNEKSRILEEILNNGY